MSANDPIAVKQGEALRRYMQISSPEGGAWDLTGRVIAGQVRSVAASATVVLELTDHLSIGTEDVTWVTDDGEVTFEASSYLVLDLSGETTAAVAAGRYVYDLFVDDFSPVEGPFVVEAAVTR